MARLGYGVVQVQENVPTPPDNNLATWSYDPALARAGIGLSSGRVDGFKLLVRRRVTVTTAYYWTTAAGSTLTAGQNFIGLYDSDGNRLASVNTDAAFAAAAGVKTVTLPTPLLLSPGFYWFAFLTNGGTPPQMASVVSLTDSANAINVGLTAAFYRSAQIASGQTSLPASFTPSGINLGGTVMWCALA